MKREEGMWSVRRFCVREQNHTHVALTFLPGCFEPALVAAGCRLGTGESGLVLG